MQFSVIHRYSFFLGQQGYCIRLCLLRDFQTFLRYGQNIFGSGQLLLGFHQPAAELPRRYPLPTRQNRIDFLKLDGGKLNGTTLHLSSVTIDITTFGSNAFNSVIDSSTGEFMEFLI